MKVGELIKCLEGFDPELKVIAYVPDMNLDEVTGATVKKVFDDNGKRHMLGRYEELWETHERYKDGLDALILITN